MKNIRPRQSNNIPTILVVFGATGDLVQKKIVPALFHLFISRKLPTKFHFLGTSRKNLSDTDFRQYILGIIERHIAVCMDCSTEKDQEKPFAGLFSYKSGDFSNVNDYHALASVLREIDDGWGVCANKLFYLAVPPGLYEMMFKYLAASGLTKPCSPREGWTRVIVEKPFGKDLKTSRKLDALLGKLFKEIQIYRIDHYLAKEMLQNILTFRFSNNLFELNWGNQLIERIEIKLLEKIGAEDRGSFYDGVGTLRDVGQNHLLQMLALTTMDQPQDFSADAIRAKRRDMLKTLKVPTVSDIKNYSFRAQYDGYRKIKGVEPDSKTETYFKVVASLLAPRWQGIPVTMESGKRLGDSLKEIAIIFRHPSKCLCPPDREHYQNKTVIRLEPKEEIEISFWSKKPGLDMDIEERALKFRLREEEKHSQYTEEYQKLLLDCIAGDQTLFVSTEEVEAMWRYIDPIIEAWGKNLVSLETYKPDTKDILETATRIDKSISSLASLKKEIAIIGLGKMGGNIARQLMEKDWRVVGLNKSKEATMELGKEGLIGVYSLEELAEKTHQPRIVWLMVPSGKPVDETIDSLIKLLDKNDIVIDGGNSFYKDSMRRAKKLARYGIKFIDVGVSGGPSGARRGASLMIGGDRKTYEKLGVLFGDLAVPYGYGYVGPSGSGHFVKMIHNGIEYGMMQAIAEGFTVLKNSKYKFDLKKVADIYNHGSVIESRLVGWLVDAIELYGKNLKGVSGTVEHTGEGDWTVQTAKEANLKIKIIEGALKFRIQSEKNQSYTGKILSALRNRFGGHDVK